jgi:hypothetical protein
MVTKKLRNYFVEKREREEKKSNHKARLEKSGRPSTCYSCHYNTFLIFCFVSDKVSSLGGREPLILAMYTFHLPVGSR